MKQLRIVTISGATYPIDVYIADTNANNKNYIGTISAGPVPPTVNFNVTIPSIFQTADEVMLIMSDANECEIFRILDCTYCIYEIVITEI